MALSSARSGREFVAQGTRCPCGALGNFGGALKGGPWDRAKGIDF